MATLKGWIKEGKSVKETENEERTVFWNPKEEMVSWRKKLTDSLK